MKRFQHLFAIALLVSPILGHTGDPADPAKPVETPTVKPDSLLAHMETLADETNRISYAIGVNIARNLKANFPSVNMEFLRLGLTDVFDGSRLKLNEDLINTSIARYNELSTSHVRQQFEEFRTTNLRDAERFLEQNGKKEGVVTLPSGLEYRVISPGTGAKPNPDGMAMVQYHGRTLKGLIVDSPLEGSKKGPAHILIKDALPFWREALPLMPLGAKWELYIHPKLAYRETGHEKIPPNELLIYTVEIVGMQ